MEMKQQLRSFHHKHEELVDMNTSKLKKIFEHTSILGTLKSPQTVFQAYEEIIQAPRVRSVDPEIKTAFLKRTSVRSPGNFDVTTQNKANFTKTARYIPNHTIFSSDQEEQLETINHAKQSIRHSPIPSSERTNSPIDSMKSRIPNCRISVKTNYNPKKAEIIEALGKF
jgi:hypothetical protein